MFLFEINKKELNKEREWNKNDEFIKLMYLILKIRLLLVFFFDICFNYNYKQIWLERMTQEGNMTKKA